MCQILTPELLFEFLEQLGVETPTAKTVRGYQVRLKYGHAANAPARTRTHHADHRGCPEAAAVAVREAVARG